MAAMRTLTLVGLTAALMAVGPPPASADGSLSNFPWTSTVFVPAGGMGYTGSPDVPIKATRVTATVSLSEAPLSTIATVLALVNKRERLVYCARIGAVALSFPEEDTQSRMLGLSLTLACFQIMNQVNQVSGLAATPCPGVAYQAPMTMTSTGGQYTPTVTGPPVAAGKAPVRATCRINGETMTIKLRTRKHKALRKYLGSRVFLGFTATSDVQARVTYSNVR